VCRKLKSTLWPCVVCSLLINYPTLSLLLLLMLLLLLLLLLLLYWHV